MTALGSYFPWDNASRGATPCIRDDRETYSYAAFADRVDAVAEQLSRRGIVPGDVVATFLTNRAELILVMAAAWRVGAIATPVNPAFTDVEADYQLDDAAAKVVVSQGPIGSRQILEVGDLAIRASADWQAPSPPADDATALLIYTSGSTGAPKGVRLSHANLHFMAASMVRVLELTAADHALLVLPLFHVNAICVSVLAPFLAGGQVSVTGKFSVSRFFDDVRTLRPTYFSGVPTVYGLLVTAPEAVDADVTSVRAAICGAAPISPELLALAQERFGFPILEGYGLTEGTCASACNPLNGERKLGSVGPALPGQRITIVDSDGGPCPTGVPGEVVISGPSVMQGYLNRPEETAKAVVDGRLHTGDVGFLDEDGYLTLVDRIKDMIIRGGENIYPKEIEAAIATHPAVLECAVVGAPDGVYGQTPVAYVSAHPGTDLDADAVAAHVKAHLTRGKRPSSITVVDDLPRNPVGKIDKPALRRMLSTG